MGIIINGKEKYRLDNINQINAKFNLIIGGRNIGKTYSVKEMFLDVAFKSNGEQQFAYIRRWSVDLKRKYCEQYFADNSLIDYIKKISKGKFDCVVYWEEKFYFAKTEKNGSKIRGYQIGQAFALSQQEHYKSLNYSNIVHGIYEEWITNKQYLPHEPHELENLISTIERDNYFRLYMCGNTLSRIIPYVNDWNLYNFEKQEKGTIDTYTVETGDFDETGNPITFKIAVENCSEIDYNIDSVKRGLIVKNKNDNMIKLGMWQADTYPNRDYDIRTLPCHYEVVLEYNNFKFLMRLVTFENITFWDVERKTTDIKENTRIIGNQFHYSQLWTKSLTPLTSSEQRAFAILANGAVVFCDNLTGTEFYKCLENLKKE